jgi:hypothetical protein
MRNRPIAGLVLVGVPLLIVGFVINPGPPAGASAAQLIAYAHTHYHALTIGGWLQVTGTLLTVLFALAIVVSARAVGTLPGVIAIVGSIILVAVNLSEVAAYVLLRSAEVTTLRVGVQLITGIQLGYSIVAAPCIFGALGYIIMQRRILHTSFAYSAFALAAVFWTCGLVTVISSIQGFINVLSAVQALWWLAAGIVVAVAGLSPIEGNHAPESV